MGEGKTRISRALRANGRVVAVVAAAAVLGVAGLLEAAAGAALAVVLLMVPMRRRRPAGEHQLGGARGRAVVRVRPSSPSTAA
jgi:hypothetical protein